MATPESEPVAVLGKGSVGVFLAAHLSRAGHAVTLWARLAPTATETVTLVAAGDERSQTFALPQEATSVARPDVRHVLVCVRGEQIDAAVADARRIAPQAALGLAASLSTVQLTALRTRYPGVALYTIMPMFNCWPIAATDGHTYHWLQPPLVKTLLSGEGDAAATEAARYIAAALVRGGMRARVVPSGASATLTFYTAGMPVLAGWELGGWTAQLVPTHLRRLTARAVGDSLRVVQDARDLPARLLRFLPSLLLAWGLGLARLLVSRPLLAMWQHHGPKISAQTRAMLDAVVARAEQDGVAAPSLVELRRRLP